MRCPQPPAGEGRFDDLLNRAVQTRVPLHGSLELTWKCNLRCVHCFQRGLEPSAPELSGSEWRELLDEATRAGCLGLTLSGGEPLAREDFAEIYSHAHDRGALVVLFTNGTLLRAEHLRLFRSRPPMGVEISLYGARPETYRRVTGSAEAFEQMREGVRLLRQEGHRVTLKSVALSLLADELDEMRALARELGCGFRWDATVVPRLDGDRRPLHWRLSPHEVVLLDQRDDPERRSALCRERASYQGKLFRCAAARTAFHLDPTGNVSACILLREPSYSSRAHGFLEAWRKLEGVGTRQGSTDVGKCHGCSMQGWCRSCPALSKLEEGNVERPVRYHCDLTRVRRLTLRQT